MDPCRRLIDAHELAVYNRLPITLVRGLGATVYDSADIPYLDMYGGHAVAVTGHCHPHVVDAISTQAQKLLFYSSSVYEPMRAQASVLLAQHARLPGARIFHCVSGSEANEVALKIARKATGRSRVVAFTGSFHGRTLGALSVCGLERYRQSAGVPVGQDTEFVALGDLDALQRCLASGDVAAVLCEPIQSLAGVVAAPAAYYVELAAAVREAGALLIFDEVQTGMARTGAFLFAHMVGVQPDLVTLAKGLASGIPASAVIVDSQIAQRVERGDQGSTFGGGPIAMAALAATLEVIDGERLADNAAIQGQRLAEGLTALPHVRAVRGRGLLLGLELDVAAKQVQLGLLEAHVIAGVSSDPHVLRLLPPLIITAAEVEQCIESAAEVLAKL